MKFDYTKAFKLVDRIPNLSTTFALLPSTRTAVYF